MPGGWLGNRVEEGLMWTLVIQSQATSTREVCTERGLTRRVNSASLVVLLSCCSLFAAACVPCAQARKGRGQWSAPPLCF